MLNIREKIDNLAQQSLLILAPVLNKYGIHVKISSCSSKIISELDQSIKRYKPDGNELIEVLAKITERIGRLISGNRTDDAMTLINNKKDKNIPLVKGEELIIMAEDLRLLLDIYMDQE